MDPIPQEPRTPRQLPADVDTIMEVATPALTAVTTFNRDLVETCAAFQNEWFGFLNRRWRENMAMPTRLSICQSLPEVQQVYLDYWKRVADQYGAEFQHLGEITQTRTPHAPNVTAPKDKPNRAVAPTPEYRPSA